MLRFLPDSWQEAVLRPFIIADPTAGIYVEFMAPDLRFLIALLLLLIILLSPRRAALLKLGGAANRTAVSLVLMFALWTWTTGNGRYFLAGLMVIGPFAALLCKQLPGTVQLKFFALAVAIWAQLAVALMVYSSGNWSLTVWRDSVAPLPASPLRDRPATFLTVSGISFSALVPLFHSESRWSNIAGQHFIDSRRLEYARLRKLIEDGPRPIFVVLPEAGRSTQQPSMGLKEFARQALSIQGLKFSDESCAWLESRLIPMPLSEKARNDRVSRGFWLCQVEAGPKADLAAEQAERELREEGSEVFEQLERRCPRFFRPGDGRAFRFAGGVARIYTGSDTRVYVEHQGQVYYRYFRALNATHLGSAASVARGEFELDCSKMPGRYRFPWQDSSH